MRRGTVGLPRIGALDGVRWRWVLAAGAGVGVIPQLLLFPVIFGYVLASALASALLNNDAGLEQSEQFGYVLGAWGLPVVHMLLAFFAASWVARRIGTAPVLHGTLIALVSVVVGQIAGLAYEPLYPEEVAKYLALALAGGLLGGIESRATLSGQEALYEASRAISEAHSPRAIANAIGDNPVSPAASGIALWWAGSPAEGEETAIPFPTTPEAWTPWFLRGWPDGLRLDGADVPQLAGSGRPAPRMLRPGELSTSERAAWRQRGIRSALLLPLVAPAGGRSGCSPSLLPGGASPGAPPVHTRPSAPRRRLLWRICAWSRRPARPGGRPGSLGNASAWPMRSTTPWPRASPASS